MLISGITDATYALHQEIHSDLWIEDIEQNSFTYW